MADKENRNSCEIYKNDSEFLNYFQKSIKELRGLVISNIEYYQRGKSSIHACFYASSCILLERTQILEPLVTDLVPKLHIYDFSERVPANGYRSFISIVNRCCIHLIQLCRHINVNKSSLLFRSSHYLKELEGYVDVLGQLMACLGYLQQLMTYSKDGDLFLGDDEPIGDDLLLEVEMLNTDCFYGRCLGFQFSESMQKVLQTVVIAMATFSECYEESSQVIQIASSLLNGGKYFADYDLRAKQVVDVTRTADIKFCKAFWSITDSPLLHQLRSFTFPHVEVSEVISLEPESFELPKVEGCSDGDDTVTITPPCAHTGPASIKVRLISHVVREGMQITRNRFQPKTGSANPSVLPPSRGLLFHCHGGGFVAQSSQSHENYLRVWSRQLEMPILSVDYALAPELPFPRGLEESFFAYAWALKNPEKLGWTGERVCFAGDSAGGNIVMSTALRAVSYQIRVPDGIVAAYMASLVQYTPSPARLMSMIDPLLPVGILTRCLAAYAGIADKFSSALATPIFCNPGKFENWEMVESPTENMEDPIVEVIANHKSSSSDLEGNSANESTDNKTGDSPRKRSCSKCNHDVINFSKSSECCFNADQTPDVFHLDRKLSLSAQKESENSPRCASIENLSENDFVVCDKADNGLIDCDNEKVRSGTTNNKDEGTVIQDTNTCSTRQDIENVSSDPNDEAELEKKSSDTNECDALQDVSGTNSKRVCEIQRDIGGAYQNGSEIQTGSDIKADNAMNIENSKESIEDDKMVTENACEGGGMEVELITKQETLGEKDHVQSVTMEVDITEHGSGCPLTVEDLLKEIDSKAVIDVEDRSDTGAEHMVTQDQATLYAVCQELLDDEDEKCTYTFRDMKINRCHSLEDLVPEEIINEDCIDGDSESGQLLNFGSELSSNRSDLYSDGLMFLKQKSDSDGSDSGIHDTGASSCLDNQTTTSKVVPQDSSLPRENHNPSHSPGIGLSEDNTSSLQHNKKLKFSDMSLDLLSFNHQGQRSSSHGRRSGGSSPMKLSPLSPSLSPGSRTFKPKFYSVQRKITQSPIQLFRKLPIVKNMYMSPLLAPDDVLQGLPPVHLTACHFDPLLDDSIMFAKKLSKLNKSVSLKVFDNLPHGFLSFSDASVEARQASNFCCDKIKEVLENTRKF